jgi:hypothetical protein
MALLSLFTIVGQIIERDNQAFEGNQIGQESNRLPNGPPNVNSKAMKARRLLTIGFPPVSKMVTKQKIGRKPFVHPKPKCFQMNWTSWIQ